MKQKNGSLYQNIAFPKPEQKGEKGLTTQQLLHNFDIASTSVTAKHIRDQYQTRFCKPSYDGIKEIIDIENKIISKYDQEWKFIRASELIPLGSIHFLTGTSQNRSISTSRNLDTCGDLSVALALEGLYMRKTKRGNECFKYAGFDTTLRPQKFYPDSKEQQLRTHFQIYGNAIAAKEKKEFYAAKKYIPEIIVNYLDILNTLEETGKYNIHEIEVNISDLSFTQNLLNKYTNGDMYDFRKIQIDKRSKEGLGYSISEHLGFEVNEFHSSAESFIKEYTKHFPNNKDLGYLLSLYKGVKDNIKQLERNIKVNIRYGRVWGTGQYPRMCFNIAAKNDKNEKIFFADGGLTNWGEKLLGDKNEYCIIGGLGTDIIANNFRKNEKDE